MDRQKLEKWNRWIAQIETDMINLLSARQIYKGYGEIVVANPEVQAEGATFHSFVVDGYVTQISMAVRRQLDTDPDTISLAHLITEIKDNPGAITRADYVARYKDMPMGVGEAIGNQHFTELAGPGDNFDPAIAQADLETLKEASRKLKSLADRKIAHRSKQPSPKMTFNEVDECIEVIKKLAQKYITLLTGGNHELEPVLLDWREAFTKTWIKKSA